MSFAAQDWEYLATLDGLFNTDTAANTQTSISDDDVLRTKFKEFGFYTVKNPITAATYDVNNAIETAIPTSDLYVVFLNTAACDNRNFELMKEMSDPGLQLQYLETELKDADANNKAVWIVGNLPPGSPTCNHRWAERYNYIVERY